jgi:hypothetical protein
MPLLQLITWPGVLAVEQFTYSCAHGISPGRAILVTTPQRARPLAFGDLAFGDGVHPSVTLRDCRVARITGQAGAEGQTWTMEIEDRRWMWPNRGGVSGTYNRLDKQGKLIPWTIRSPKELAEICLKAMGEVGYVINLPEGLTRADGKDLERYLQAGENFRQSLTNPPTVWDHTPPAEALARLADYYGCRVVFQPNLNRVVVTTTGVGTPLPDGPCDVLTGGADAPRLPSGLGVAGAPVRFQGRFALEAVGEEWDGRVVPINDLSYAPKVKPQAQVTTCTFAGSGSPDFTVSITLHPGADDETTVSFFAAAASGTVAQKMAALAGAIAGHPGCNEVLQAGTTATTLTLTARDNGVAFAVDATSVTVAAPDRWYAELTTPPGPGGGRSWRQCPPPMFPTVEATDRLSYSEAVQKAQKSVFRWYRIVNIDTYTGQPPVRIPMYGEVKRLQQVILENAKVDQVVPSPRIPGAQDKNNPIRGVLPSIFQLPGIGGIDVYGGGVLPWFYDGYSRDQPAVVYGSVYKGASGQPLWTGEDLNTPADSRVFVDFEIDPYWQVVMFGDYVWKHPGVAGGTALVGVPSLVLECACRVVDHETGAFVRWEETRQMGGQAPFEWAIHEDVMVGVIGLYEDPNRRHRLTGHKFFGLEDARGRASYYLAGMAARYQLPLADTRQYIGVYAIDPDGLTQQVTWSLGPGGPTTVASANTEHAIAIPPYPARRLAENLGPHALAATANLIERAHAGIPEVTG